MMTLLPISMRLQRWLKQTRIRIPRSAAATAIANDRVCASSLHGMPARAPATFPSALTAMNDPISQETSHAYPASPRRIVATA